jgi:hypothetical protein
MPSVLPPSVPDTALGLTPSELVTFRQHQTIALGGGVASSRASVAGSTSTRGRGASRSSVASSSRAGSAASSAGGGGGRLMLDAGSLSVLGAYFERLMGRIQERVDYVSCCSFSPIFSQDYNFPIVCFIFSWWRLYSCRRGDLVDWLNSRCQTPRP